MPRLPFEGEPHHATWCCWPFDDEEWKGRLRGARLEFARFMIELSACEKVEILVADEESFESASSVGDFGLHRIALDDCWFRDSGPIFVYTDSSHVAATVWRFNAWGGKYDYENDALAAGRVCEKLGIEPLSGGLVLEGGSLESDGEGVLMTTKSCLLPRNPQVTQSEIESIVGAAFGVKRWIWLESGLEGDHTDGHIDTLARFAGPGVVLACSCSSEDPNYEALRRNRQILRDWEMEVVDLPLPVRARYLDGVRVPETYANYYMANGAVFVPQYGDVNDERALAILREQFPDRRVVGLASSEIITSGGSFHCLTQQQPEGLLCDWRSSR